MRQRITVQRGIAGSVVGPLLFLIYGCDIANGLENPCPMFVNDFKLLETASSEAIQRDLNKVYQWSTDWDLSLHLDKRQRLVEGEENCSGHLSLFGHQVAMEQKQKQETSGLSSVQNPNLFTIGRRQPRTICVPYTNLRGP